MTNNIITLALLLATLPAQAGSETRHVVGRAPGGASATVFSEKHDVITCIQSDQPGRCHSPEMVKRVEVKNSIRGWREEYPTEDEYASARGYKLIHRRGVVIQNGTAWVIMEVSK